MTFTTIIKSIVPNHLPFRSSSKPADASISAIAEHVKTKHGHGLIPSNSINVVLFGESGVGKSSVLNLVAGEEVAKVSSDVRGCTMESTKYNIEFDGMNFAIFDTIGLEQPRMEVNGYLKAIEKLYELIINLSCAGGVHLLLFCMRGGKISATTQSNYRLFSETLQVTGVPIAVVFTGLEQEVEMEDWWRRNKTHVEGYGIKSDDHACITTLQEETLKYAQSQKTIRELLKICALRNTASSLDALHWFASCARDMDGFIERNKSPERKKVLAVLVKRCKLDPETAKKIADTMEKGDSETQPAPSKDRQSKHSVVPRSSEASFSGKTTGAGQPAQGGNNEEESRFNTELNASGRQKTKHANEYVVTPNHRSVREGIRRPKEESITDDASRAVPSPNVREGIRSSRKEPHADSMPNAMPSTVKTAVQPKRVPNPGSADKTWSVVPAASGESPKKVSNPDSGAKTWSATALGHGNGQFRIQPGARAPTYRATEKRG